MRNPADTKELKFVSARAIKKLITSNQAAGISAQTVQALNAMVDELVGKIALESYRTDEVLHISQNVVREEIKSVLTSDLNEAIQEALKVTEYESLKHTKKSQWEALIFQDMASERQATLNRPQQVQLNSSESGRRYLIPYHRIYSKLDAYCEKRQDLYQSEEMDAQLKDQFREDPHFSPISVVFITCALEFVVMQSILAMCRYVNAQQKDVIKMEDMLQALEEDVLLKNMFKGLSIQHRLKRKISTHKNESRQAEATQSPDLASSRENQEIGTEFVPPLPKTKLDNALKLENLLDNMQQQKEENLPSEKVAVISSKPQYVVREEPSPKRLLMLAQQVKKGEVSLSDVSDEAYQRNNLIEFLEKGNAGGILTGDTRQKSHSAVDLNDLSSPEAQRNRQAAAALFINAKQVGPLKKQSVRISEIELLKQEALQEKKFKRALVDFLMAGQPQPKKSSKFFQSKIIGFKGAAPVSQDDVANSESKLKTKSRSSKLASRSAVAYEPDADLESSDEVVDQQPKLKQKQSMADFLRESGPEVLQQQSNAVVMPKKRMVAKVESSRDLKKLAEQDQEVNDHVKGQSLADFLREGPFDDAAAKSVKTNKNFVAPPAITVSSHEDITKLQKVKKKLNSVNKNLRPASNPKAQNNAITAASPTTFPAANKKSHKMVAKIESGRDQKKYIAEDSDEYEAPASQKVQKESLADFLSNSGPAVTLAKPLAPLQNDSKKQTKSAEQRKVAKQEFGLKKQSQATVDSDEDNDVDHKKRGKQDFIDFLQSGPPVTQPPRNSTRRTSTGSVWGKAIGLVKPHGTKKQELQKFSVPGTQDVNEEHARAMTTSPPVQYRKIVSNQSETGPVSVQEATQSNDFKVQSKFLEMSNGEAFAKNGQHKALQRTPSKSTNYLFTQPVESLQTSEASEIVDMNRKRTESGSNSLSRSRGLISKIRPKNSGSGLVNQTSTLDSHSITALVPVDVSKIPSSSNQEGTPMKEILHQEEPDQAFFTPVSSSNPAGQNLLFCGGQSSRTGSLNAQASSESPDTSRQQSLNFVKDPSHSHSLNNEVESVTANSRSHSVFEQENDQLANRVIEQEQEIAVLTQKLNKTQKMFDDLSERAFKQIQDLVDERDLLKLLVQMLNTEDQNPQVNQLKVKLGLSSDVIDDDSQFTSPQLQISDVVASQQSELAVPEYVTSPFISSHSEPIPKTNFDGQSQVIPEQHPLLMSKTAEKCSESLQTLAT